MCPNNEKFFPTDSRIAVLSFFLVLLIHPIAFSIAGTFAQRKLTDSDSDFKQRHSTRSQTTLRSELDECIERYVSRFEIPGAAIAVVKDGKVLYRANFGMANLETKTRVSDETVFSLYSVSKLIVATGVFQLIEEGKLTSDDRISKHLDGLPQSWHSVTIQNLLTHSSGLPPIAPYADLTEAEARKKVFEDKLQFPVGDRFRYTQTNYWLLNRIIAKLSGKSLQDFIREKQFSKSARDSLLFIDNNVDRLDVRAKSYLPDNEGVLKPTIFSAPEYLLGAGGFNLTLSEFISWNEHLDDDSLIQEATKQQMWEPFKFHNDQFAMANGWGIYSTKNRNSFGFTGGGRVGFRKFPKDDLSIIVLTSGYRHRFSPDLIVNRLAGIVDSDLKTNGTLIDEEMFANFNGWRPEVAVAEYHKLKVKYDSAELEQAMNMLGYEFLLRKKTNVAMAIFKLNTEQHPGSWNVWDSLGECQAAVGSVEAAISNYKKSIELNPKNESGKAAIARMKKKQ